MNQKKLIIIYGPTGVGKTEYALGLGESENIEIINGDVGQFYEPLAIGTAKPDWKNEEIPHHLFDVLIEPKDCTVVEYRNMVLDKVQQVWDRGSLPVIVGGSGFYIKSLFYMPKGDKTIEVEESKEATQDLWQELKKRDPQRAEEVYQQDRYRIERALVLLNKGIKASDCAPEYKAIDADVLLCFLNRPRTQLYERINQRTHIMFDAGWIKEVELLMQTPWQEFLMRKKLIGYNDIITYFETDRTEQDKELLFATIQKKTRNYAKRQLTFWRMLEKLMNKQFQQFSQAIEVDVSHETKESFKERVMNFIKG
ncbi:MAG: tRNA dimethylallyltransferase [Alteromonas naphthalenivorans]|jgi:tRNA dimethylallyltransferase